MRWPWAPKLETRAGYTDARLIALLRETDGNAGSADDTATAAIEMCAGTTGRGFMAAEVMADSPTVAAAITPGFLEMLGRAMIKTGNLLFYIDTSEGDLMLLPASSHFVRGGPGAWTYDFSLAGPTNTLDYHDVPASSVLHFRYATPPMQPWLGISPTDNAALSGRLSAATVRSLGYEMAGPMGHLLGVPVDGDDPSVESLRGDLADAKGGVALVEVGNWDAGDEKAIDLMPKRYGANPGAPLVDLAELVSREIMACCGYNPAMFVAGPAASQKEAYRIMLFGVLAPLGKLAAAELTSKLGPVDLEWTELRAADIQARGRTVGSLVTAGATFESAAREVGFKNLVAAPAREVERAET